MGDLYWDGMHGVERSHEEAMTWFAKSAEQGNTDAEYSMGFAYLSGSLPLSSSLRLSLAHSLTNSLSHSHACVSPPQHSSVVCNATWRENQGKSPAALTRVMCTGQGVERDMEQGAIWLTKAADKGEGGTERRTRTGRRGGRGRGAGRAEERGREGD
eukprot:1092139-Rhodomonas_salina.1